MTTYMQPISTSTFNQETVNPLKGSNPSNTGEPQFSDTLKAAQQSHHEQHGSTNTTAQESPINALNAQESHVNNNATETPLETEVAEPVDEHRDEPPAQALNLAALATLQTQPLAEAKTAHQDNNDPVADLTQNTLTAKDLMQRTSKDVALDRGASEHEVNDNAQALRATNQSTSQQHAAQAISSILLTQALSQTVNGSAINHLRGTASVIGHSSTRAAHLTSPSVSGHKAMPLTSSDSKKDLTDPHEFFEYLNQSLAIVGQIQGRQHESNIHSIMSYAAAQEDLLPSSAQVTPGQSTAGMSASGINTQTSATQFYKVELPLSHEGWSKAMSQQVIHFMKNSMNGDHIAQMRLDPPDLGPLRVSLRIDDAGVAQAMFSSANAQVRQTLEQALPDLQRAMSAAGLTLSHAGVDDHAHSDNTQQQSENPQHASASGPVSQNSTTHESTQATTVSRHEGLVNTFA